LWNSSASLSPKEKNLNTNLPLHRTHVIENSDIVRENFRSGQKLLLKKRLINNCWVNYWCFHNDLVHARTFMNFYRCSVILRTNVLKLRTKKQSITKYYLTCFQEKDSPTYLFQQVHIPWKTRGTVNTFLQIVNKTLKTSHFCHTLAFLTCIRKILIENTIE
jgi:hypothetical protein